MFVDFLLNDVSNWGDLTVAPMLGGRERATVAVAEQLVKRKGTFVTIYAPNQPCAVMKGVFYDSVEKWQAIDRTDHIGTSCIAVNGYDLLAGAVYPTKIAWIQTGLPHIAPLLKDIDAVVVNSPAKLAYLNGPNHGLLRPPKVQIIGNGVDLAWWDGGAAVARVPGRLLYSQSPDRGLVHLLRWWPELKRRLPNLSLHVTYSIERIYDFQWAHELRAEMCRTIDQARSFPDVTFLGVLSAEDYRTELKSAELYVFPCDPGNYGETFSIGCMEACAAYTPILGSGDVSIAEIYDGAAHIVYGPIWDQPWVDNIQILMTDSVKRTSYVGEARTLAESYQWADIAKEWEDLLLRLAERKAA